MLPEVEREFVLDEGDLACRACGGALQPMAGQFEESEMVDVVEVRYELVKVKQQKYTGAPLPPCRRCTQFDHIRASAA